MDHEDDVLLDFVNWWDGWTLYGDMNEESQELVDKFLAEHYPSRTSKVSPKSTEEVS